MQPFGETGRTNESGNYAFLMFGDFIRGTARFAKPGYRAKKFELAAEATFKQDRLYELNVELGADPVQ